MEYFVFGSNLRGVHGAGSAKAAYLNHHARWGCGDGPSGRSYAIPTKDYGILTMHLHQIKPYVTKFIEFAKDHPEDTFNIVAIGCGLAGYTVEQMKPLFEGSPDNCIFAWDRK